MELVVEFDVVYVRYEVVDDCGVECFVVVDEGECGEWGGNSFDDIVLGFEVEFEDFVVGWMIVDDE